MIRARFVDERPMADKEIEAYLARAKAMRLGIQILDKLRGEMERYPSGPHDGTWTWIRDIDVAIRLMGEPESNSDPGLTEGSIKHAHGLWPEAAEGTETSHAAGTAKADAQEPGPAPEPLIKSHVGEIEFFNEKTQKWEPFTGQARVECVGCGENPAQYCHACYEREL